MNIEMPLDGEILTSKELEEITGRDRKSDQIAWLKMNGWVHTVNAHDRPVVGRWYTRMKMAGIEPTAISAPQISAPDFSKAR